MGGETRLLQSHSQLGFRFRQISCSGEVGQALDEEQFETDAAGDFYIGDQRLDEYLKANQQGWVIRLKVLLSELDYSAFVRLYRDSDSRPIHPRVMLGLIIYGIIQGKWSLRELARLALMDLGAKWIVGRLRLDHSTLGKFIQLHEQVLSETFFTALIKQLVSKLHLTAGMLTMDRNPIAAAARHYRMLRAEASREVSLSEQVGRMLAERRATREFRGCDGEATVRAPAELEAAVQPSNHGPVGPGYKPRRSGMKVIW